MKKAGFRLLHHAGFDATNEKIRPHQKEQTMHFSEVSIVTSTALYVQQSEAKNAPVRKHTRILRGDIASTDVEPSLRSLGRHIAESLKKGRRVRIPAMNVSEWGHVLRALELKRAFN